MTIKWCAEIGSNHNQNLDRTIKLIKEAKKIGCDFVKFQLFKGENLYHSSFGAKINQMRKWELPSHFLPEISRCCKVNDIRLGISVFDLEAVEIASKYADCLKIGSYELLWHDLIKTVVKTGKPWMISSGMADWGQISKAISLVRPCKFAQVPMAILHCNSNYPARPQNCCLNQISLLNKIFPAMKIGWSDHTTESGVIYKAVALGAKFIEFHFDLEDGLGYESSIGHCWKPDKIGEVIHNVRIGEIEEESTDTGESEAAKWRTDPTDGLRPLKKFREELLKDEAMEEI